MCFSLIPMTVFAATEKAPVQGGVYEVEISESENKTDAETMAESFTETGTGDSEADAYQISTYDQLTELSSAVNGGNTFEGKFFKLTDDIDISDKYNSSESGLSWTPIGNVEKDPTDTTGRTSIKHIFKGTFDGNNKEISGLYINADDSSSMWDAMYKGLFGLIENATVKDLKVSGEVTTTGAYVGGIAGYAKNSVFENCESECVVNGKISVGGIVGIVYSSNITGCANTGDVTFKNSGGGIAGYSAPGTSFENCLNTGRIKGEDSIGGIVGFGRSEASPVTIKNCVNAGKIENKSSS